MANLTGNLKDSMTATFPREFDIPNPMTIQEIYDKINARAAAFQMPFSIKGGVPGERIVFAKEPNLDVTIWLHVKDIAGSHVIIKTDGKKPPERTIVEAARLAAFHSKAKNGSGVPVDFTAVKFVKKPAGARPGMVIFTDNKTLFVTPNEEEMNNLKIK